MATIQTLRSLVLLAFALAVASSVWAEQPTEEAQAAADRYLRAVPMGQMMEDTYAEMAKQVPADRRAEFIADMRAIIKVEKLEAIAREAMLKTFTADEMNAMADFFSSKHGASAMSKYGAYMAQLMPPVMREVQRGIQELQAKNKNQ